jgi:flagellar protein FlbD
MLPLTRLTGALFALNPDLIERVDRTPDTVITLVDGTKYLVRESLEDVVAAVLDYRAQVLSVAQEYERVGEHVVRRRTHLAAVPDGSESPEATAEPVRPLTPPRGT